MPLAMNEQPERKFNPDGRPQKSWHRWPKERPKQFEYFRYFLSIPPVERSTAAVAKHFKVSERYINGLRSQFQWNTRAFDRDNFIAHEIDADDVRKAQAVNFDWQSWEQDNLNSVREIADMMRQRCVEILSMPIVETTEKSETSEDGKTIHKTIIRKPVRFTAADAPRYAEAAIILSQFAIERGAGQSAAINLNLPKPPKPIAEMSPDEIDAYTTQCQTHINAIERGEPIDAFTGGKEQ